MNEPNQSEAIHIPVASFSDNARSDALQPRWWYAVYTRPRHEKSVSRQLEGRSLESFLPVREAVHRWNDRKALVAQPLFPSYVFVRIRQSDRAQVVKVPGVVAFVGVRGSAIPIPDDEIARVRHCFTRQIRMERYPYLATGRRVRIKRGPLSDMEGILVRRKGQFRLVLSITSIMRSVAVEVDVSDVEPLAH